MQIEGSTFLVTGGASGLGAATAEALMAAGATVVVADLADAAPAGAILVQTDVTDEAQVSAAVTAAASQQAPLRGVINCAGICPGHRVLGRSGPHPQDLFDKVLRINLGGTFNVTRLAAAAIALNEPLADGERGVIINTASAAAYDGQIGQAAYAAAKGGVVALTLPLARDLASVGVRVVSIAPGLFGTAMIEGLPTEAQRSLGGQVPFPSRLGAPSEYADLVCHIITNRMLNGEVVRLDGALRMAAR